MPYHETKNDTYCIGSPNHNFSEKRKYAVAQIAYQSSNQCKHSKRILVNN